MKTVGFGFSDKEYQTAKQEAIATGKVLFNFFHILFRDVDYYVSLFTQDKVFIDSEEDSLIGRVENNRAYVLSTEHLPKDLGVFEKESSAIKAILESARNHS